MYCREGKQQFREGKLQFCPLFEAAGQFGVDAYRYFLLREVPFGSDGTFSEAAMEKRYTSDLANDLGNLVYRTLTMMEKLPVSN